MTAKGAAFAALSLIALLACRKPIAPPAELAALERRPMGTLRDRASVPLAAGTFDEYDLGPLAPGEAVHVVLEQRGIDVVGGVIGEDGRTLVRTDEPTGKHGFEHVCFVSPQRGTYRLFVEPLSAEAAGRYGIRLQERSAPPANQRIAACEEALRAFAAAERHRAEASAAVASLYARAIELWRRSGEPFPLAIALKQAGSFASLRGDLAAALAAYDEALGLLRAQSGEAARRQLAAVLNLAGLVRDVAGEPERARAAFAEARAVARQAGDGAGEAAAISNLALWETSSGDLYRAIDLHRQALALWRRLELSSHEATTLNVLGVTLTQLGLYGEALDVLNDALAIRRREGRPEPLANTGLAIGWAEHLSGRNTEAVGHLTQALGLYRKAGDRLGEAGALDRLGSAAQELGRVADARRAFATGLAIYRAAGDRLDAAHSAANLGCLLADRGLLDEAATAFERFGDRAALAQVRYCQARRELDAGHPDAALSRIETAVGLIEQLRDAARRRGHPAPTVALWQKYSELHVAILMRLHERDPRAGHDARAFEVSDLERARHLYELLAEARVEVRSGVPEALLERERVAQRQLNATELRRQSLLQQKGTATDVAPQEKAIRELLRNLAGVEAEIRTASPRFAELRRPSPVPLAEVRRLLGPDVLLLSYVLGDERSFLFVVSRRAVESHILPPRREIEDLAWRVYEGLRNSRQRRTRQQLPTLAGQLSDILLGPVRSQLVGRRLLVVGDGMLHYLPFAALPLPDPPGDACVVDRYQVVHLPSAAVLKALRRRAAERRPPAKEIAVLADAVYSAQNRRLPAAVRQAPPPAQAERLLDLPYTRQEAESILALVAPEKRLAAFGFAARPDLVRGGSLRDYRILHFATHGLLNEEHPQLSGIALSMFDEQGRPLDGNLRLHEIYALDLPADLVVLSACRTALTQEAQGEGLVGLTHGFFYAGASRLVVSLWDVHDRATADLMTVFYRGLLQEKLSPPEALRAAQRWMRQQEPWRAPYYWAGFVLEGDWR